MRGPRKWPTSLAAELLFCSLAFVARAQDAASQIGREVAVPRHLQDGDEYQLTIPQLIAFGEKLFTARWTVQEGAGRPLSKGTATEPGFPILPLRLSSLSISIGYPAPTPIPVPAAIIFHPPVAAE